MNRKIALLLICLIASTGATTVAADDHETDKKIPEIASETGVHEKLVAALNHVALVDTLNGDGPFTVFAPTDQAFTDAGIDLDDFDTDEENQTLTDILLYHVISGAAVDSANVTDGLVAQAANGDDLTFTVDNETVMVGAATVTTEDVEAANGIIHVIDKVLMPPADEPEPTQPTCDEVIGIGSSGLAYDRPSVSIEVGQTVCWKWENSDMKHNVAEIEGPGSTEILAGGIYSGASEVTVDFAYTFTENTTFYYACEPHIASNMKGEIIVGTGVDATETSKKDDSEKSESTPGFLAVLSVISMIGAAVAVSRKNTD